MNLVRVRLGLSLVVLAGIFFLLASCDDNSCKSGDLCACSGGFECFLGCFEDDCNLACNDVGGSCGAVCGDGCRHTCARTGTFCSTLCENDCSATCHDMPDCRADCGERCNYECFRTGSCGVRVGPGSFVRCYELGRCIVECEGPCTVECASNCDVRCGDGRVFGPEGGTYQC